MITTGNIVNADLVRLFEQNFDKISSAFLEESLVVELNNRSIIIHE